MKTYNLLKQKIMIPEIPEIQAYLRNFKAILQNSFSLESCKKSSELVGQITFKNFMGAKFKEQFTPNQQYKDLHRIWAEWKIKWNLKPNLNQDPHSLNLNFIIQDKNLIPYSLPNLGFQIAQKINQINQQYQFLRITIMQNNQISLRLKIAATFLTNQTINIIRLLFGQGQKALINDLPSIFQLQKSHLDNLQQWYQFKKGKQQLPEPIKKQQQSKMFGLIQTNDTSNSNYFKQALHNYQIQKSNHNQKKRKEEPIKIYTITNFKIFTIQRRIHINGLKSELRQLIMNIDAFPTINNSNIYKMTQDQIHEFRGINIIEKRSYLRQNQQIMHDQIQALAALSGRDKIIRMPKYFLARDREQDDFHPVILVQKGQQNLYQLIKKLHKQDLLIQSLKYYRQCMQILFELQHMRLIHRDFRAQNIVQFRNNKLCAIDFAGLNNNIIINRQNISALDYKRTNQIIQATAVYLLPTLFFTGNQKKQFTEDQFNQKKQEILYELFHPNFDMYAAGILLKLILKQQQPNKHKPNKHIFIPQNLNTTEQTFFKYLEEIIYKCKEKGDHRPEAIQIHYVINQIINCAISMTNYFNYFETKQ